LRRVFPYQDATGVEPPILPLGRTDLRIAALIDRRNLRCILCCHDR